MAIICGGTPTPDDLAAVQEFQAALAMPTEHLTRLALLEMDTSGLPEVADALARHAAGCDQPECRKRIEVLGVGAASETGEGDPKPLTTVIISEEEAR